jgi:hypothetical protein
MCLLKISLDTKCHNLSANIFIIIAYVYCYEYMLDFKILVNKILKCIYYKNIEW